jgi:hypothetical protein
MLLWLSFQHFLTLDRAVKNKKKRRGLCASSVNVSVRKFGRIAQA